MIVSKYYTTQRGEKQLLEEARRSTGGYNPLTATTWTGAALDGAQRKDRSHQLQPHELISAKASMAMHNRRRYGRHSLGILQSIQEAFDDPNEQMLCLRKVF